MEQELRDYKLGTVYGCDLIVKAPDLPTKLLVEKELTLFLENNYPSISSDNRRERLQMELEKALIELKYNL